MARTRELQSNFAAGELDTSLHLRRDTQQYRNGAARLRNVRLRIAGGLSRRPGSLRLAELTAEARCHAFKASEAERWILSFAAGRVDIHTPTGTLAASLTSAPWTGDRWRTLKVAQAGNVAFVTHPEMPPQMVRRTAAGWVREAFAFERSFGQRIEQPHYKLAPSDVTLRPSGYTGAITIQLSADWLVAGHVGARFRYLGKELEITGVTDARNAAAVCIDTLPSTQLLAVASTTGLAVGHVVEGRDTKARGIITAVLAGHVRVAITEGLTTFTAEKMDTPIGVVQVTNFAGPELGIEPDPVEDWTEQLFGAVHGYPACVALHRNRLLFGGHPAVPSGLIASRVDNLYSFDLGAGDDADAIFDLIGDAIAAEIQHIISAEQLIVLTDAGPYYVPEGTNNPFTPARISFARFGDAAAGPADPVAFDGGVVMARGGSVHKLSPTGNLTSMWESVEVSLLASHLVRAPGQIAATEGFADGPERYVAMANSDGTLAVMMLNSAQEIRNFVLWETSGQYRSVVALGGDLYALAQRNIAGSTRFFLERFDPGVTLDWCTVTSDLSAVAAAYAGSAAVVVAQQTWSLGPLVAAGTGPGGPYQVGLAFTPTVKTLPPYIDGVPAGGTGLTMRLVDATLHMNGSARWVVNGVTRAAYDIGEDLSLPPRLRYGANRSTLLGRSKDPAITITQADPLPLELQALSYTVGW